MYIQFEEKDPNTVIRNLEKAMGQRELSRIVKFAWQKPNLTATISKLGKSVLTFQQRGELKKGCNFHLVSEKISLSHKAFKGVVSRKIVKLIEEIGGTVEDT